MPSATTTSTTTLRSKPIHIPKLTYRNAAPPLHSRDDSAGSIPTLSSAHTNDSAPLSRSSYNSRLSFRNGLSYTSRESTSTFSTSASSLTVSTPPSSPGLPEQQYSGPFSNGESPSAGASGFGETPTKTGRKKGGSIFSFFALKEPSTQAFADFQEQARRQAAAKNGRPIAVGLPGVSSAKLPPTVPKVNSKWDGVPETAKDKHKRNPSSQKRTGITGLAGGPPRRSTSTLSSISTSGRSGTMVSQDSNGREQNNLNGTVPKTRSAGASSSDLSSQSHAPGSKPQSLKSPSTASLLTTTSFFLPEIPSQYAKDAPPVQRHQPSLAQRSTTLASSSSEARKSTNTHQTNFSMSSNDYNNADQGTQLPLPLPPFPIEVVLRSSGAGVLGPPMTTKRKPKAHAFPAGEAEPMKTPETEFAPSILKREPVPDSTPIRPPMNSYPVNSFPNPAILSPISACVPTRHPETSRPKLERGLSSRSQESTPWELEQSNPGVPNHIQSTPQPVYQSGKKFFRRGIKSVFSK
ncbi:MAG: hypothetical protein M1812_001670 [Candelaria pacifica]|nr:MAG: hypothetical protein M1812_001670 [Candelaria pacifica]